MTVVTFAFAILFALVHLGIGVLRFLDKTPRSRWLSAAGGIAVAYVFLHVLPELATHGNTFAEALNTTGATAEDIVYGLALAGLVAFYGLERVVKTSRKNSDQSDGAAGAGAFWLHIGSFSAYNFLIGYLLLHREETDLRALIFYGTAMTVHFITNDFGLRSDHKARYDHIARWILAGAVLAGWLLGYVTQISETAIGMLFAFLAGGVVLNVLKEELPEERESRFLPFLLGGAGYMALLLAI